MGQRTVQATHQRIIARIIARTIAKEERKTQVKTDLMIIAEDLVLPLDQVSSIYLRKLVRQLAKLQLTWTTSSITIRNQVSNALRARYLT